MKTISRILLCFAVTCGQAFAGLPAHGQTTKQVRNVALDAHGVLRGVAIDRSARPLPNAKVVVQFGQHIVARTTTRADGSFAIGNLRGGMHVVRVGSKDQLCQLWVKGTAPPNSIRRVAISGGGLDVRGQFGVPSVGFETIAVAVGAGLNGGIIGYEIKDDDQPPKSNLNHDGLLDGSGPSSP